jgi:hypothetical protein
MSFKLQLAASAKDAPKKRPAEGKGASLLGAEEGVGKRARVQPEGAIEWIQGIDKQQGVLRADGEAASSSTGPMIIPLIRVNQWSGVASQASDAAAVMVPAPQVAQKKPQPVDTTPKPTSPLRYGLIVKATSAKTLGERTAPAPRPVHDLVPSVELPQKTLEEEAMDALMQGEESTPVPILALNAVPGLSDLDSEAAKLRHDISLRPDHVDLEAYERVPIEAFGKALLMGMGWREGGAVGRNGTAPVPVKQTLARPHLLGLGADPDPGLPPPKGRAGGSSSGPKPAASTLSKSNAPARPDKESTTSAIPTTSLPIGCQVTILTGRHKGRQGKLVDLYEKSSGLAAKVHVAGEDMVRVWADEVRRVREAAWLQPGIIVRYVGPNTTFHRHKGVVQDLLNPRTCLLHMSTPTTQLLHGVREEEVTPTLPRRGGSIMVIRRTRRAGCGARAEVMEYDDGREEAFIRLSDTLEHVWLPYDVLCALDDHHLFD